MNNLPEHRMDLGDDKTPSNIPDNISEVLAAKIQSFYEGPQTIPGQKVRKMFSF